VTTVKTDADKSEAARQELEKAKAGDPAAAHNVGKDHSAAAEAAEQVASDGPKGVGLAR
jgi:hypothetical protein